MWGPRLPRGRLLWGSPVPVELYICEALIVLFLGSLFSPVVQAQLSSVIAGRFLALDIQFFESQLVDESEKVSAVGWGFLGASFIFFIPPSCHHSSRLSSTPPPLFFGLDCNVDFQIPPPGLFALTVFLEGEMTATSLTCLWKVLQRST